MSLQKQSFFKFYAHQRLFSESSLISFLNFWFLRLSGCAKEFCSSAEASEMYEVFGPQYPESTKDTIMSVK